MVWLVLGGVVYLIVGLVMSRSLIRDGVAKVVPAAADATRGFRWMITPGVVMLWPLVRARVRARVRAAGATNQSPGKETRT